MQFKDTISRAFWEMSVIKTTWLIGKENKKKLLEEFEKWFVEYKEAVKKKQKRKTIRHNIRKKCLNWYCTLTFKNDKLLKKEKLFDGMRKLFRRYGIDYCLVPEYGEKNGRYHIHGFLGCRDEKIIKRLVIDGKEISDKFGNPVFSLLPWKENYGHCSLVSIEKKDNFIRQKLISYTAKYAVKGGEKMLSSRSLSWGEKKRKEMVLSAVDFLGDIVKVGKK